MSSGPAMMWPRPESSPGQQRTLPSKRYPHSGATTVAGTVLFFLAGIATAAGQPRSASQESVQAPPAILWNQTVPMHPPDTCLSVAGNVENRGVAIGPDQNPVVLGEVAGASTVVVIAKYDRDSGERIWCSSFPVKGAAGGSTFLAPSAEVGGIAIDSSGTVFIGGHGRTGPLPPTSPGKPGPTAVPPVRYFVTKCSALGMCATTVTFIAPPIAGSHDDSIGGIAIGPDGNPVLTGLAQSPAAGPSQARVRMLTVKVNGSTLGLLASVDAPSNAPGPASSVGVAVDASNEIFVTGTEASTSKYDSRLSPQPLWTKPLTGARIAVCSHERGEELAVLGATVPAADGTRRFAVTRLDPETGATLRTNAFGLGPGDVVHGVTLDRRGDAFVVGDHRDEPTAKAQDALLLSLSQLGELNWTAVFPTRRSKNDSSQHSFFAVAAGTDGDPVVTGYSDAQSAGSTRAMNVVKYDGLHSPASWRGRFDAEDDETKHGHGERDKDKDKPKLAWDEPTSDIVTGFRVCIDEQTGSACQDVGLPKSRTLHATTPGSLTYELDMSTLTSLTPHSRRISVVAYNTSGNSALSPTLTVSNSDFHRRGDGNGKHGSR